MATHHKILSDPRGKRGNTIDRDSHASQSQQCRDSALWRGWEGIAVIESLEDSHSHRNVRQSRHDWCCPSRAYVYNAVYGQVHGVSRLDVRSTSHHYRHLRVFYGVVI